MLAGCGEPSPPAAPTPPNVVLIVVDTLRADRLSQYGYELPTSTALSELASGSTRFTQAQTPAAWTLPSVASLFLGLAPARHGVDKSGAELPAGVVTLAESLRAAGFETAGFSFNPYVSRKRGFDRGFQHFSDVGGKRKGYPDVSEMIREASRWLEERNPSRPFLLYLQPMNVHGPYRVPAAAAASLLGRAPAPGFAFFGPLMSAIMKQGRIERRGEVTPEFVRSLQEEYATAVHYSAEQIAGLLELLRQLGLFDSSLVIFTADHGEELYDRGGFAHGYSLYREIIGVPLFVKLPGQTRPRSVDTPVSLVDLYPTVLDLLGLPAPQRLDGVSLRPLLEGPADAPPPELAERALVSQATNPKRCVARTLRRGAFELMVIDRNYEGVQGEVRLYNLEKDPGERSDLAGVHPELRDALRERLERTFEAFEEGRFESRVQPLDEGEREALEALGYL